MDQKYHMLFRIMLLTQVFTNDLFFLASLSDKMLCFGPFELQLIFLEPISLFKHLDVLLLFFDQVHILNQELSTPNITF